MAKFYGQIGFAEEVEVRPGYIKNQIVPHTYRGDIIQETHRYQTSSDSTNDSMTINSRISILSDIRANNNIGNMKWIELYGTKWKIGSIEPKYPRLIISIGGVWNENGTGETP